MGITTSPWRGPDGQSWRIRFKYMYNYAGRGFFDYSVDMLAVFQERSLLMVVPLVYCLLSAAQFHGSCTSVCGESSSLLFFLTPSFRNFSRRRYWDTLPTASLRLRRIAGWERRIVCSDCLYCGNRFVTYSSHTVKCVFFSSIAFVLDLNLSVSVFL